MARDKGFLTEVTQEVAAQLEELSKFLREFNTIPMGTVRMTPRQVRQAYGMGLREIQELEQVHGADVIGPLLEEIARGGNENARP